MRKSGQLTGNLLFIFGALCIVFIPFPFHLFPFQQGITDLLFGKLVAIFCRDSTVYSDSAGMLALLCILLTLSIPLAAYLSFSSKWQQKQNGIHALLRKLVAWYLALMLLKYGCDKLFKMQFYLPEPNILYTPLGQLDKDILYWSTMGVSRSYSMFSGMVEVLCGLLLLIRRTRSLGAFLAIGILLNILALNVGFGISVKLYSAFLLMLALLIALPDVKKLYRFFILKKESAALKEPSSPLSRYPFLDIALKCFFAGLVLLEALYPAFLSGTVNDDKAARPYLHGAYEVKQMIRGKDTLTGNAVTIRHIFIHRQGYIIFQYSDEQMQDYRLETDSSKHILSLMKYDSYKENYSYFYNERDSTLQLFTAGRHNSILAKALNWRKLPALQP